MEGEDVPDPLELSKNLKVIKAAQEEAAKLDILVCGECHDVFHHLEGFKEHKQGENCPKTSKARENHNLERKAQIWGFMLWKNAQTTKNTEGENETSWAVYQRWCKLNSEEKNAWVVAGQTVLSFTKIGAAKMQEVNCKTPPLIKNKVAVKPKTNDDEPLEEGEIRLSQLTNAQRIAIKAQVASNKANSTGDTISLDDSEVDGKEIKKAEVKKVPLKPVQLNVDKPSEMRKVLRTGKDGSITECVAERILSRRFSHKKKIMEYCVKWESSNETELTWEPKTYFEKSKWMVEEFDRTFNKPKIVTKVKPTEGSQSELSESEETGSRPQRTSKQKALNQVKAWCGDITEGEDPNKRKFLSDDDDSSDSFEKKIKMEDDNDTDTSEDEKPIVTYRKVVRTTSGSVNGVTKKPEPVFTPSATQRVVRVNQKQLPHLSSGVYIMSKADGIIKLDSTTTSAGSPLLKVGQKIGQTHIKVVKKEPATTPVAVKTSTPIRPKLIKASDVKPVTSTPKVITKVVQPRRTYGAAQRRSNEPPPAPEKSDESKITEEDESDGVEEMDFPMDLPLPSPDSPPGDFTLCPLTGKIIGQSDLPEVNDQEDTATSLDVLVKQAVSELSDVDMAPPPGNKIDDASTEGVIPETGKTAENSGREPTPPLAPVSSTVTTSSATPAPGLLALSQPDPAASSADDELTATPKTTTTEAKIATKDDIEERLTHNTIEKEKGKDVPVVKTRPAGSSILSAALTNAMGTPTASRVGPTKKLLSTTPHTIRQKIISPGSRTPVSSTGPRPTTTIIHKITPGKNRPVMPKTVVHQEPTLNRSSKVTTYKPASVARRIGNTTIYKTSEKPRTPTIVKSTPVTPQSQPAVIQSTSTVISMPLLTPDEEPAQESTASLSEIAPLVSLPENPGLSDLATFTIPESDTPLLITGDDGTIYQVAGQNEDGQTILISEGPDGQQQCVLVSSDATAEEAPALMMDGSAAPAETNELQQALMVNSQAEENAVEPGEVEGENEESQVVAQIIKADPPSPGGTRKVVLMLPDGNLMMTDVTAEQYAALELDK